MEILTNTETKEIKPIPAPPRRSFASFCIDYVFMILVFFIGSLATSPLFDKLYHIDTISEERTSFYLDSGLVFKGKDGTLYTYQSRVLEEIGEKDSLTYKDYEQKVFNYYTVFLVQDKRATTDSKSQAEAIRKRNRDVFGLPGSNPYYTLDETISPYPVLKEDIAGKAESKDESTRKELLSYYVTPDGNNGIYDKACYSLYTQPYRKERNNRIDQVPYTAMAVWGSLSAFVFFFLVPLLSEEGKTLGKRRLHLSVLDKESGKNAGLKQRAIHYSYLFISILVFFLRPYWYLKILCFPLLIIDDFVGLFSKSKQSIHERLAKTYVSYLTKERKVRLSHPMSPDALKQNREYEKESEKYN